MLGFLARFSGCFILAAALAIAIGDIARSLSADALRLSTIGQVLSYLNGQTGAPGAEGATVAERVELVWGVAMQWPAAPVLAGLALVLLFLGRRRREPRLAR